MKVLVTGGNGFVAPYVAAELGKAGHSVSLTSRKKVTGADTPIFCELSDGSQISELLRHIKPEAVVHLVGTSRVEKVPMETSAMIESNVVLTQNICHAIAVSRVPCHFLFVSTGAVYGSAVSQKFEEKDVPTPMNAYGFSKLAGENVALSYASDKFKVTIARPFNHTGAGQRGALCPDFANRIAMAHDGESVPTGDLSVRRDISDVRDIARAYRLILEKKPKDDIFVLGSGKETEASIIFDMLKKISGKKVTARMEKDYLRKNDPPRFIANPSLAKKVLGWETEIPLEETLRFLYEHEAQRLTGSETR